jgi:hypothetical protein
MKLTRAQIEKWRSAIKHRWPGVSGADPLCDLALSALSGVVVPSGWQLTKEGDTIEICGPNGHKGVAWEHSCGLTKLLYELANSLVAAAPAAQEIPVSQMILDAGGDMAKVAEQLAAQEQRAEELPEKVQREIPFLANELDQLFRQKAKLSEIEYALRDFARLAYRLGKEQR